MSNYKITVERGKSEGTLTYDGNIKRSFKCWWDLKKKIPASTYNRCSATTMKTKKNSEGNPREAIFIPSVAGYSGIFIHMGNSAAWSDGCIVIVEKDLKEIYKDIRPKDGQNVTVQVADI